MAKRISQKWQRLMSLIPGYDPIATAPPGYWFDVRAANHAIEFFHECLRHVKGDKGGEPFLLEPHQQAKTGCIFGWKDAAGNRRYTEVFDYEPRKQGKTPWCAGIVLYVLATDKEKGMEIYSAACDREQAGLVFQYAYGMLLQEPELKSRIKVYTAYKSFEYLEKFAYYKVLSGIPDSKHGLNVHLGIIDETHSHKSPDLIDIISTGTAARSQPLIIHTTTADWLRESVCNEKYDYACKVRDRVVDDPHFLPIIFEATPPIDEDADPLWWTKERAWRQANPNFGISVKREYIEKECQRAIDVPRLRNTFKRLHLNIRTGVDTSWFGLEGWDPCYDATFDVDELRGEKCYAGLDLASTSDLIAFVLWFPEHHTLLPYFWLPSDTVKERYERNSVPYPQWVDEGHIHTTPGNVADYDMIRTAVNQLATTYDIKELAIDRWNAAQLITQLQEDGFEVVPFGQGFASMSAPSKELERLIKGQILRHDGNPVMRWQASHVAIDEDAAENIKPSKKQSSEKIDGMVALIMAIGRAMVEESEDSESVYETRGLITI